MSISSSVSMCSLTNEMGTASSDLQPPLPSSLLHEGRNFREGGGDEGMSVVGVSRLGVQWGARGK
jgi:hypothetical protein